MLGSKKLYRQWHRRWSAKIETRRKWAGPLRESEEDEEPYRCILPFLWSAERTPNENVPKNRWAEPFGGDKAALLVRYNHGVAPACVSAVPGPSHCGFTSPFRRPRKRRLPEEWKDRRVLLHIRPDPLARILGPHRSSFYLIGHSFVMLGKYASGLGVSLFEFLYSLAL